MKEGLLIHLLHISQNVVFLVSFYVVTPIIFAEDEESKQLLASNREVIASCL